MQISIESTITTDSDTCLIVPVAKQPDWSGLKEALGESIVKLIQSNHTEQGFSGDKQQTCLLNPNHDLSQPVLLIGIGDNLASSFYEFNQLLETAYQSAQNYHFTQVCSLMHLAIVEPLSQQQALARTIISYYEHSYQFRDFKTQDQPQTLLTHLSIAPAQTDANTQAIIDHAQAVGQSIHTARYLGDLPANHCHPEYLEDYCHQLAQQYASIQFESLSESKMQQLGMGALLSVAHGSEKPAKLITMHYQNGGDEAPIALIGKGITYDTGGYQLKAPAGMLPMKYDMCGSATVIALMELCARLQLPINIVGVVAAAENMISDRATRLSDIVTSMSGRTIEITNSDAEGRLALCDAMTYTQQTFQPKQMITTATLTGAALITFEHIYSALMGNNEAIKQTIQQTGDECGDLIWPLPMHPGYAAKLKSPFADTVNTPTTREASTIIAAQFLEQFVEQTDWAHVDVAGTASQPKNGRVQSTGRPVALLSYYLIQQS